jgi:hypothetical protein
MRLLVQGPLAVGSMDRRSAGTRLVVQPLDLGLDIEEALGPQEIAVVRLDRRSDASDVAVQGRMRCAVAEIEVPRPALRVKAPGHGQGLDQGRLARAVLADQEGDARVEGQGVEIAHHRQVERVGVASQPSRRSTRASIQ